MPLYLPGAIRSQVEDHALHWQAKCYKIALTEVANVVYRFTDHAEPLELFDGSVYESALGMDASALRREAKLSETNRELRGLISSDAIKDSDLRQGLFNNATVEEYTVDWRVPFLAPIDYVSYIIRSVTFNGSFWTADTVGLSYRLSKPVGDFWGPMCRVELFSTGNGKCNAPSAPYVENTTIDQIYNQRYEFRTDSAVIPGWATVNYGNDGFVIFRSGSNAGHKVFIKSHVVAATDHARIVLQKRTPFDFNTGDTVTLYPGCNKRWNSDCLNKFANVINFQGEPFIPGDDQARKGIR